MSFIADMHRWEIAAHATRKSQDDHTSRQKQLLGAMVEVFQRWCTSRQRKCGRLGAYSIPPEYQPNHEKVVEVILQSQRKGARIYQAGDRILRRSDVCASQEIRPLVDRQRKDVRSWMEAGVRQAFEYLYRIAIFYTDAIIYAKPTRYGSFVHYISTAASSSPSVPSVSPW